MEMSAAPSPLDGRPLADICTTLAVDPALKLQLPPTIVVCRAEVMDALDRIPTAATSTLRSTGAWTLGCCDLNAFHSALGRQRCSDAFAYPLERRPVSPVTRV